MIDQYSINYRNSIEFDANLSSRYKQHLGYTFLKGANHDNSMHDFFIIIILLGMTQNGESIIYFIKPNERIFAVWTNNHVSVCLSLPLATAVM